MNYVKLIENRKEKQHIIHILRDPGIFDPSTKENEELNLCLNRDKQTKTRSRRRKLLSPDIRLRGPIT